MFDAISCQCNTSQAKFRKGRKRGHCLCISVKGTAVPVKKAMLSKPSNYGAVGVEDGGYMETDLLTAAENEVDNVTCGGRPLAWIIGIGAMVTLALLSATSGNHQPSAFLMGSSLPQQYPPFFYDKQQVDHFDDDNTETWSNRYYKSTKYFKGAGHPIFMVVGGEGAMDDGFFYPFVTEVLAKRFSAAVLQIEHRFYGPYVPIANATNSQLEKLLTPSQAMADMVKLTRHVRDTELTGCSPDRDSPHYCPVITVGGSYPGFLSAMFRIVHGDFVDISYASSAPLLMYAQMSDQNIYYDIITSAADRVSPGCSRAVRTTMDDMIDRVDSADTLQEAATRIGVCPTKFQRTLRPKTCFRKQLFKLPVMPLPITT